MTLPKFSIGLLLTLASDALGIFFLVLAWTELNGSTIYLITLIAATFWFFLMWDTRDYRNSCAHEECRSSAPATPTGSKGTADS